MEPREIIMITVQISPEDARLLALFLDRTSLYDYAAKARCQTDEAHAMRSAGRRLQAALADAGFDCEDEPGLEHDDQSRVTQFWRLRRFDWRELQARFVWRGVLRSDGLTGLVRRLH